MTSTVELFSTQPLEVDGWAEGDRALEILRHDREMWEREQASR